MNKVNTVPGVMIQGFPGKRFASPSFHLTFFSPILNLRISLMHNTFTILPPITPTSNLYIFFPHTILTSHLHCPSKYTSLPYYLHYSSTSNFTSTLLFPPISSYLHFLPVYTLPNTSFSLYEYEFTNCLGYFPFAEKTGPGMEV